MKQSKIKIPLGRAHTDEMKEKIMADLLKVWKSSPQQRLGQLISNSMVILTQDRPLDKVLITIEDDDLIRQIKKFP